MMRRGNPRRGFTLIETLLALMVFSTVLVGYIAIMGQNNRIEGDLAERYTAAMLAQNVIEEIRLVKSFETGEKSGEFPGDYEGYRWMTEITADDTIADLYEVRVRVIWNEQEHYADDYELRTMMAKFTANEDEEAAQ